jgi:uncharacterized membrane protein YkoI
MVNRIAFTALVAAGLGLGALSAAAESSGSLKGHELAAQAKISPAQARAIALKARPGKIVDEELEKEAGGSGLRYSFDVQAHRRTYEVGVDARTGAVLENGAETPAQEAAEARGEGAKP